jgi:hypothetical protein
VVARQHDGTGVKLLRNLGGMGTVLLKDTCGRKLSQLVAYHVLSDENGVKNLAVVHQKGLTDEVRRDCRTPRPSLDWTLDAGVVVFINLFEEVLLHERPLF